MRYSSFVARVWSAIAIAVLGFVVLPGCSSEDDTLVLVSVPVAGYPNASMVEVTAAPAGGAAVVRAFTAAEANAGNLGVYLPSDSSGPVTVAVVVYDAGNRPIATGSVVFPSVAAGRTSGPLAIILVPVTGGLDGGQVDGAVTVDAGTDAGPGGPDVSLDGGGLHDTAVLDSGAADALVATDAPLGLDAAESLDAQADVAVDTALGLDAGPDLSVDVSTTMNVLARCTSYTHVEKTSSGELMNFGIRQLLFSRDGKYLVSLGEDGRGKVWRIEAGDLVATPLIFIHSAQNLTGDFSPDGKYLAIGDQDSAVKIYDFEASLQYGSVSLKWSLPREALSPIPNAATVVQYTTDGDHLVVAYSGDMQPDPNQVIVWDVATQQVVRRYNYAYADKPRAVVRGAFTGPMWVSSVASRALDGGSSIVVTLTDIAQATPQPVEFVVPDTVGEMAFSPDGNAMALALDNGEVGLWDITTKGSVIRLGSPVIAASDDSADCVAFAPDGKYLAATAGQFFLGNYKVYLSSLQSKTTLQTGAESMPWSLAFAPDGLALAVGLRDYGQIKYCRP